MSASSASSDFPSSTSSQRASWNIEMEGFFLNLLCAQIRKGKKSSNNFKSEAWKEVKLHFNEKYGLCWELQPFKTKYAAVSILFTFSTIH